MTLDKTYWRQRSRAILLKKGDWNTKFFHRKASNIVRRDCIKGLYNERGYGKLHQALKILSYIIFKNLLIGSLIYMNTRWCFRQFNRDLQIRWTMGFLLTILMSRLMRHFFECTIARHRWYVFFLFPKILGFCKVMKFCRVVIFFLHN